MVKQKPGKKKAPKKPKKKPTQKRKKPTGVIEAC